MDKSLHSPERVRLDNCFSNSDSVYRGILRRDRSVFRLNVSDDCWIGAGETSLKTVNLAEIKTNPNNPRLIKDDKFAHLKKSLKEFPQMMSLGPIVVDDQGIV